MLPIAFDLDWVIVDMYHCYNCSFKCEVSTGHYHIIVGK